MRSLANISIACIFALMVLGKNGWAQSTVLSGENTIIFPYVDVPFLQSYTVISEGTKNSDGSCSFPLDSEAAPYPLTDTQRWITVQRAFDPDSCQELIEKGVVDLSINPEVQELLSLPGADAAEAFIKSSFIGEPDMAVSAVSSKTGKVRVWFTDKNNPTISTINGLGVPFDGFMLSSNQLEGTYSQSNNCQSQAIDGKVTEQLGLIGWYRYIESTLGLSFSCGYGTIYVSAVHANDMQFYPFLTAETV